MQLRCQKGAKTKIYKCLVGNIHEGYFREYHDREDLP
jgi:hypothetical protein